MKRIVRNCLLTPEETAKYNSVRAQVATELLELIARHEHRMTSLRLAALLGISTFFVASICTALGVPNDRQVMRTITEAQSLEAALPALTFLFSNADSARLTSLKANEDNTVALRAAWKIMSANAERHHQAGRVPSAIGLRFVGFAEGRLRTPVPKWWRDQILTATWSTKEKRLVLGRAHEAKQSELPVWEKRSVAGREFRVGEPVEFDEPKKNNPIYFTFHGRLQSLSTSLLDYQFVAHHRKAMRFHFNHKFDLDFVAFQDDSGTSLSMSRVERWSNANWDREVWRPRLEPALGTALSAVSITTSSERVSLFGEGWVACYAISTGVRLASFAARFDGE